MLLVLVMVCYLLEIAHSDSCLGVYNDLVYDFKKGESWSNIGQCILHRCKGDNQVIIERCPNVTLHRGCTLSKEDPTKYFPGCCPYPLCNETEAVMCVDAQDRSRHAPGDQWQPSGECVHKECVGGGLTLVSKCTINQLPPGCSYLEFDLSLNFPKCCPRVVCGNKTEESEE